MMTMQGERKEQLSISTDSSVRSSCSAFSAENSKPEERCVKPFEGGEGCGLAHHLSRKIAGPGERILKVQPADIEGAAAGQQE